MHTIPLNSCHYTSYSRSDSFWSYEYCKRLMSSNEEEHAGSAALKVLLCGGIAGIVTWASVFPLDMIKTRLQANTIETPAEARPLLQSSTRSLSHGAFAMARHIYQTEGLKPFYRGLGVCSLRAFIVNAAQVCPPRCSESSSNSNANPQWATYEWLMKYFQGPSLRQSLKDVA
jgi:solute carrier family 25 carnitine/acylcarnitine transporter 20/29